MRGVVHVVKRKFYCQSKMSYIVDKMLKIRKSLGMMVCYQNRFTLIGFTETVVQLNIDYTR